MSLYDDPAFFDSFRTCQDRFGILIDFLHNTGTEAKMSVGIAGITDDRTVGTAAVDTCCKVFRMCFKKTLHIAVISKAVAIGEISVGKA